MKKTLQSFIISLSLLLTACVTSVPEPSAPPAQTILQIEKPVLPDLTPSPVYLNNQLYSLDEGIVCLNITESYNNVKIYFTLSVGRLFEGFLKGLGYTVKLNPTSSGACELIIDLVFEIELLSGQYPGTCYTGIDINGEFVLTLKAESEQEVFEFGKSKKVPTSIIISEQSSECYKFEDNQLVSRWHDDDSFTEILNTIWGARASVALLGISGSLEGIDALQRQAWGVLWNGNQTSVEVEYIAYSLLNNFPGRERLLHLLEFYSLSEESEILIPVFLWNLDREVDLNDSDQIKIAVREMNLLQDLHLDQQYEDSAVPLILDLAATYYGEGLGYNTDEDEDFLTLAIDVLAGMGPEIIPRAVWYLYHHQEQTPEAVELAVWVLSRLAHNGYEEEVGEQAGAYLCFLLYLQENGEFDFPGDKKSEAVFGALRFLFPEAMNGSYGEATDFYRAWRKAYG